MTWIVVGGATNTGTFVGDLLLLGVGIFAGALVIGPVAVGALVGIEVEAMTGAIVGAFVGIVVGVVVGASVVFEYSNTYARPKLPLCPGAPTTNFEPSPDTLTELPK